MSEFPLHKSSLPPPTSQGISPQQEPYPVQVRMLSPTAAKDLDASVWKRLLWIEQHTDPRIECIQWTRDDFLGALRTKRNYLALAFNLGNELVGYTVYRVAVGARYRPDASADLPSSKKRTGESPEEKCREEKFLEDSKEYPDMVFKNLDAKTPIPGFIRIEHREFRLLNFKVDPRLYRKRIGSQMLGALLRLMNESARVHSIKAQVWEANLGGQLFLKSQGFRCVSVLDSQQVMKIAQQFGTPTNVQLGDRYNFVYYRDTLPESILSFPV